MSTQTASSMPQSPRPRALPSKQAVASGVLRPRSLRTYLVLLMLAAALPVLIACV